MRNTFFRQIIISLIAYFILIPVFNCSRLKDNRHPIIFVTYAELPQQLYCARVMVESIRTFGSNYKDVPVWLYVTEQLQKDSTATLQKFASLNVDIKTSQAPEEARWFSLANIVFMAAQIETDAESQAAVIVMLGPDTVILQALDEFILPREISLGYRPVFHRNINPLFSEPLDDYWARAYEIMSIQKSTVFPMVTPADDDTIRPYFQAGCLAVRPEKCIFRKWKEQFTALYSDSLIRRMSQKEIRLRIFTFQVALTGAILNNLERLEMMQFSDKINYPIFFREMFGAKRDFHDITNTTTIRYESFFNNPPDGWDKHLTGPADRIAWLKEHFDH
jgi:hypothetical protein